MKQGLFLNPQYKDTQETYNLVLHKRVRDKNTPYQYSQEPNDTFKGRPANKLETKTFRILKGVNGSSNSITVRCSNLPDTVEIDDMVIFMGKTMLVKNIGYFYDDNKIENAEVFSNEYLAARCPKGITLG